MRDVNIWSAWTSTSGPSGWKREASRTLARTSERRHRAFLWIRAFMFYIAVRTACSSLQQSTNRPVSAFLAPLHHSFHTRAHTHTKSGIRGILWPGQVKSTSWKITPIKRSAQPTTRITACPTNEHDNTHPKTSSDAESELAKTKTYNHAWRNL